MSGELKKNKRIQNQEKRYLIYGATAMILLFIIGGLLFIFYGKAASPSVSYEAESSSLAGNASIITDSSASNRQAIILGTNSVASDCLVRSSVDNLSGTVSSYIETPLSGYTVDARNLTVKNYSSWLVTPGSSQNICWYGGEYFNTITDAQAGNPVGSGSGTAWGDIWHHNGGFTLKYSNANWIFDSVAVHHTGDAFNISTGGDNFEVRNSHIYDIRDDCLQNDYYLNGSTHDNLFESCYNGFSSKASQGTTPNGTGRTWNIYNNIVYIAPTYSVYKGDSPGSVYILKWAKPSDGLGTPEHLIFKNNIVRIDKCPFQTGSTCNDSFYFPADMEWSGNSLYWGGTGPVPASLANWFSAAHGSKLITKAEWDAAVSNWKTAHPGVK